MVATSLSIRPPSPQPPKPQTVCPTHPPLALLSSHLTPHSLCSSHTGLMVLKQARHRPDTPSHLLFPLLGMFFPQIHSAAHFSLHSNLSSEDSSPARPSPTTHPNVAGTPIYPSHSSFIHPASVTSANYRHQAPHNIFICFFLPPAPRASSTYLSCPLRHLWCLNIHADARCVSNTHKERLSGWQPLQTLPSPYAAHTTSSPAQSIFPAQSDHCVLLSVGRTRLVG